MQDPTLDRNDNGSLYGEPFYFDIFDLMYVLELRYMLNLIWTLTLTFVSEKKVLPKICAQINCYIQYTTLVEIQNDGSSIELSQVPRLT